MSKITFETNIPITVALRSIEGREVDSQYGGKQHMFTCDNGVFYVSEAVGNVLTAQLRKLEIEPGEVVEICKAEVDAGRGRRAIRWQVAYPAGEQKSGTFVVPKPPAPEPATPVVPHVTPAVPQMPLWAHTLLAQTNALVDVYSAALAHASATGVVKPEAVQTLLVTAFINLSKKEGSARVAA